MVAGRPYYHAYPADFLMATQGYDLELKGAYRLLIDVLNDRDRPIPDEPKFIAGILGCSIQKWKKIREVLIDEGKIMLTEDGYHLTNPRFEREHNDRAEKRTAAQMNGHAGGIERARRAGQLEMGLDPKEEPKLRKRARARSARTEDSRKRNKVATKLEKSSSFVSSNSKEKGNQTPENKDLAQGSPQASRAPDSSESIGIDSSQPNNDSYPTKPGRLENADLHTIYEEVCAAAGFCPIQPAAIDRALSQVEKWRDLGIDFDSIVIPSVRAVVLSSDEPTRTLARFNARVLHEHARAQAAAKQHKVYRPPEIPKLNPEGEDPSFMKMRADLLEKVGDKAYCLAFNSVTFRDEGQSRTTDGSCLRINGMPHNVDPLRHGRWKPVLLSVSREYGFTEIW